jgi:hypothetical protein
MIKFFRKIRQRLLSENKLSKYLIYAIGEITLVVIGILIALSINNWNDNQKLIKQERELLENVLENIATDATSIDSVISSTNRILTIHGNLIKFSKQQISKNDISNIDLIRKSEPNQLITYTYNPNLPQLLLDQELKNVILDYYQTIDFFDKSRSDYNYIIEQHIRPILAEKELLNFDFQFTESGGYNNLIKRSKFFEAFKKEDIKQYLFEARVKLLVLMQNSQLIA